jgi:hypothetical protein
VRLNCYSLKNEENIQMQAKPVQIRTKRQRSNGGPNRSPHQTTCQLHQKN